MSKDYDTYLEEITRLQELLKETLKAKHSIFFHKTSILAFDEDVEPLKQFLTDLGIVYKETQNVKISDTEKAITLTMNEKEYEKLVAYFKINGTY